MYQNEALALNIADFKWKCHKKFAKGLKSCLIRFFEPTLYIITNFDAYEKDPNESQGCRFMLHSCLRGPSRFVYRAVHIPFKKPFKIWMNEDLWNTGLYDLYYKYFLEVKVPSQVSRMNDSLQSTRRTFFLARLYVDYFILKLMEFWTQGCLHSISMT